MITNNKQQAKKSARPNKVYTIVGVTALIFISVDAMAATQNAAGIATGITQQISAIKILLLAAAGLVGLFFAITGVMTLMKDSRQKQPDENKSGMIKIIGGIVLIGIVSVIYIAQQSVLGKTDVSTFENSGGI